MQTFDTDTYNLALEDSGGGSQDNFTKRLKWSVSPPSPSLPPQKKH